ncbi:hypothetical protein F5X99DRAFT_365026 [Biscogniauxia marginata]|nr:hypothetical protein F5X99DRAFT_365026 [Biscogniauxia marginata]
MGNRSRYRLRQILVAVSQKGVSFFFLFFPFFFLSFGGPITLSTMAQKATIDLPQKGFPMELSHRSDNRLPSSPTDNSRRRRGVGKISQHKVVFTRAASLMRQSRL